jgi:hypothetical protein
VTGRRFQNTTSQIKSNPNFRSHVPFAILNQQLKQPPSGSDLFFPISLS